MTYPQFTLASSIYQIAPRTPDHFLRWLSTLPDEMFFCPMSMDENLVALYFRFCLDVSGFERANGYSVDINGYRWLTEGSWLFEVSIVELDLCISATKQWYLVALGTVRKKLVERLSQVIIRVETA